LGGHREIVDFLLEIGFNVLHHDAFSQDVACYAENGGHFDLAEYLIEKMRYAFELKQSKQPTQITKPNPSPERRSRSRSSRQIPS